MTTINVLLTENAAILATDTRARSALGPDFDVPKVLPIPHMNLALATRGPMEALIRVAGAICVGAFDYRSARAFLDEAYGRLGMDNVEIVVAGWSEKGPAAFVISAANTGGRVLDIPKLWATPQVPADVFERFSANPVAGMPDLMAFQAGISPDCGGFMNVTMVGPKVIETYTARRITSPSSL